MCRTYMRIVKYNIIYIYNIIKFLRRIKATFLIFQIYISVFAENGSYLFDANKIASEFLPKTSLTK